MIKLIVHASVMSKDVYHGRIVPCNPQGSYSFTHVAKDVTCEVCKRYIELRAKRDKVDPDSFMKIW